MNWDDFVLCRLSIQTYLMIPNCVQFDHGLIGGQGPGGRLCVAGSWTAVGDWVVGGWPRKLDPWIAGWLDPGGCILDGWITGWLNSMDDWILKHGWLDPWALGE